MGGARLGGGCLGGGPGLSLCPAVVGECFFRHVVGGGRVGLELGVAARAEWFGFGGCCDAKRAAPASVASAEDSASSAANITAPDLLMVAAATVVVVGVGCISGSGSNTRPAPGTVSVPVAVRGCFHATTPLSGGGARLVGCIASPHDLRTEAGIDSLSILSDARCTTVRILVVLGE